MAAVIDTHTHIVDPSNGRYPLRDAGLPTGGWWRHHPSSAESFLAEMDAAGVAGAVLVQCKSAYSFDNSYACDSALAHPARFVSASIVDAAAADAADQLERWARAGMHGTRMFDIPTSSPSWVDDPRHRPLWQRAVDLGVRLSVAVMPETVPRLALPLSWLPDDVALALDHCGFVAWGGGRPYPDAAPLVALARFPQLRCKVSTHMLDEVVHAGGDPRDVVEYLAEVFGPERLLWGSDYANTHDRPYAELVAIGRDACSRLSPDEQAGFLGANALEIWPELAGAAAAEFP